MRSVMLVQLSDIHVAGADSDGLKRLKQLAGAIGSLCDECRRAVILLTGDIAFSGKKEQYDLVLRELKELAKTLKDDWKFEDVRFSLCPGNHDCDFEVQKPAIRAALLQSIASGVSGQADLVKELSEVQDAYHAFRKVLGSPGQECGPFVEVSEIDIADRNINLIVVNTSWSSREKEIQGTLRMPTELLPVLEISDDLSIALLHHPLNWYDAQDAKALSDWLDVNADIAMWGHEHREDAFKIIRRRFGSSVQHFIARPIDDDKTECGFRALLIHADNKASELTFRWRNGRFELERREDLALRSNPARQLGRVRFTKDFNAFLSDPGGAFKHPRLERGLLLQDIFIEPSFRAYAANFQESERAEWSTSLSVIEKVIAEHALVAVFGSELSGKTTLAKHLIESARHKGLTPLYFDGARLKSSNKGEITAWIRGSIERQYETDCIDRVNQTAPSSKIVLLDNVHEIPGSSSVVTEILSRISALGGHTVYFSAQNPAVTILAASHASGDEVRQWSEAKWFELLPLNNRARGQIIRRWVSAGRDEITDSELIESEARRIKALLDGTFGPGLGVKYPFFLLALLQQIDAGIDAHTVIRNGSHAHIFEALITVSIDTNVHSHDVGLTHDVLSLLAFQLWSTGDSYVSEGGFNTLISDFRRHRLVQLSHPELMHELVNSKILQASSEGLCFRSPYFYFYYLARWISQGRGSPEAEEVLQNFIAKIHTESAANVVSFVAHLGNEEWVLGLLLPVAEQLFSYAEECKLAEQATLASKYLGQDKNSVLLTGDAADISDHHHEQQDQASSLNEPSEDLEDAFKYMTAVRVIQVLGQVLRSRAGSILGPQKQRIANVSTALARRLMSVLYSAAEESAEVIIKNASELFGSNIGSNSQEAINLANRLISVVIGGVATGLVSRAAEVTATKDFVPLIEVLESEAKAVGDPDKELVALCSLIIAEQGYPREKVENFLRRIPDSDLLSRFALASSVVRAFYLQPPERAIRDSACARLGIRVKSLSARVFKGRT